MGDQSPNPLRPSGQSSTPRPSRIPRPAASIQLPPASTDTPRDLPSPPVAMPAATQAEEEKTHTEEAIEDWHAMHRLGERGFFTMDDTTGLDIPTIMATVSQLAVAHLNLSEAVGARLECVAQQFVRQGNYVYSSPTFNASPVEDIQLRLTEAAEIVVVQGQQADFWQGRYERMSYSTGLIPRAWLFAGTITLASEALRGLSFVEDDTLPTLVNLANQEIAPVVPASSNVAVTEDGYNPMGYVLYTILGERRARVSLGQRRQSRILSARIGMRGQHIDVTQYEYDTILNSPSYATGVAAIATHKLEGAIHLIELLTTFVLEITDHDNSFAQSDCYQAQSSKEVADNIVAFGHGSTIIGWDFEAIKRKRRTSDQALFRQVGLYDVPAKLGPILEDLRQAKQQINSALSKIADLVNYGLDIFLASEREAYRNISEAAAAATSASNAARASQSDNEQSGKEQSGSSPPATHPSNDNETGWEDLQLDLSDFYGFLELANRTTFHTVISAMHKVIDSLVSLSNLVWIQIEGIMDPSYNKCLPSELAPDGPGSASQLSKAFAEAKELRDRVVSLKCLFMANKSVDFLENCNTLQQRAVSAAETAGQLADLVTRMQACQIYFLVQAVGLLHSDSSFLPEFNRIVAASLLSLEDRYSGREVYQALYVGLRDEIADRFRREEAGSQAARMFGEAQEALQRTKVVLGNRVFDAVEHAWIMSAAQSGANGESSLSLRERCEYTVGIAQAELDGALFEMRRALDERLQGLDTTLLATANTDRWAEDLVRRLINCTSRRAVLEKPAEEVLGRGAKLLYSFVRTNLGVRLQLPKPAQSNDEQDTDAPGKDKGKEKDMGKGKERASKEARGPAEDSLSSDTEDPVDTIHESISMTRGGIMDIVMALLVKDREEPQSYSQHTHPAHRPSSASSSAAGPSREERMDIIAGLPQFARDIIANTTSRPRSPPRVEHRAGPRGPQVTVMDHIASVIGTDASSGRSATAYVNNQQSRSTTLADSPMPHHPSRTENMSGGNNNNNNNNPGGIQGEWRPLAVPEDFSFTSTRDWHRTRFEKAIRRAGGIANLSGDVETAGDATESGGNGAAGSTTESGSGAA